MGEYKLIKFLNGTASPQEEREVVEWLKKPESRGEFDSLIEKFFDNPSPRFTDEVDYEQLLKVIHQKILRPKAEKKRAGKTVILNSLKIAASVLLFLFSAYVMFESFTYNDKSKLTTNEVLITLTTRSTGPGEKLTLLMSDKTKIIVNSESEISFSSDYGATERIVNIKGEAFFEVTKDPSKPFKVISDGVTTTALGTAFNVYSRKDSLRIALVEGKVAVAKADKKIQLSPGLMALWNSEENENQGFSVQSFDMEVLTAWKEGKLIYNKKPFGEILDELSEWYVVDIQTDKRLDINKKVVGTFQNRNLEDILTGLSFSIGFDFEIKGNKVHIKQHKTMK